MSPDLEWHVEDTDAAPAVVRSTPAAPLRRWRSGLVILMVLIGAGLGLAYFAIPEPAAPAPTPTPEPTPGIMPFKLDQLIRREVAALAAGDAPAWRELVRYEDYIEQNNLLENLEPWGTAPDRPAYTLREFGWLSDDRAYVDLVQYRNGADFRQTRFYRLFDGEWKRTGVQADFWSGRATVIETPHFLVDYAVEDEDWVTPVLVQLEDVYDTLCADLACPTQAEQCVTALGRDWCSPFPREFTLTLNLRRESPQVNDMGELTATLRLPSPRVLGQYENASPIRYSDGTEYIIVPWLLLYRRATTSFDLETISAPRQPLVWAMFVREFRRLQQRAQDPVLYNPPGARYATDALPDPSQLWIDVPAAPGRERLQFELGYQVLSFIEDTYGFSAAVQLFKSLTSTATWPEVIEASTGAPYADFERQWLVWLIAAPTAEP